MIYKLYFTKAVSVLFFNSESNINRKDGKSTGLFNSLWLCQQLKTLRTIQVKGCDLREEKGIHEQSRPKLHYKSVTFNWVLEISISTERYVSSFTGPSCGEGGGVGEETKLWTTIWIFKKLESSFQSEWRPSLWSRTTSKFSGLPLGKLRDSPRPL